MFTGNLFSIFSDNSKISILPQNTPCRFQLTTIHLTIYLCTSINYWYFDLCIQGEGTCIYVYRYIRLYARFPIFFKIYSIKICLKSTCADPENSPRGYFPRNNFVCQSSFYFCFWINYVNFYNVNFTMWIYVWIFYDTGVLMPTRPLKNPRYVSIPIY